MEIGCRKSNHCNPFETHIVKLTRQLADKPTRGQSIHIDSNLVMRMCGDRLLGNGLDKLGH